ncbi:hypothetical protein Gasu2_18970 [Galdieria sulphuraria]|uniref:AP180 N-terminal homology (ANTH) domain-containing protein n=1 Tax=Galdieria sulphuraria TaxID=130081 RepID=M2XUZ4_GALSU|nr:uncharacterized protein Gasu_52100 [Galdieria sulphuraria]EME27229.1 hypothetical protein Gasu_52100 [Galdieria sulphuraria]GJD07542.1 hypothetical protein Gasu2_18970 [Galdieria sulphuraria]|eukprot:XP_005703749.1 hypothetical protein Gasu_52100 [Galdieria sulphuraria]
MATDYLSSKPVTGTMETSNRSSTVGDFSYREAPPQWRHDSFSSRGGPYSFDSHSWSQPNGFQSYTRANREPAAYRSVAGVSAASTPNPTSSGALVPYTMKASADYYRSTSGPVVFSAEPQSKKTVGNQTKRVTRHVKAVLSSNLEGLTLKVTKPKYKAPREVYVEQIVHLLTGLGSPGADVRTCSDIVRKLWNKCQIQDWRVCCKALYVFERIFRDLSFEDSVSFKRFLLQRQSYVLHAGETFVNFATLTRFDDSNPASRPEGPQVSVYIRSYAAYLSFRLHCFEKMQQLTGKNDAKPGKMIDEFGYSSEAGKRVVADLPKNTIFETLSQMQELLDEILLKVRLEDENKDSWFSTVKGVLVNDVTVISLYPVACDLLDLFKSIHENLASLLENFFDLDIQNASRARDIYALYTLQVPRVQDYLEIAKEQFRTRGIPLSSDLKYHPLDLLDDMDEYIARKSGDKVKDVEQPEVQSKVEVESSAVKEEKLKKEEQQVEKDLIFGDDENNLIEVDTSQEPKGKTVYDFFADLSTPNDKRLSSPNSSSQSQKVDYVQLRPLKNLSEQYIQPNKNKPSNSSNAASSRQFNNALVPKTNVQHTSTSSQLSVSKVLQESLDKSKATERKEATVGNKESITENDINNKKSANGTVVSYNAISFNETLSEFFDRRVIESKKIEVKVTDLEGELKDLKNEQSYLRDRLDSLAAEYERKRREASQLRVQVVSAQKKLEEDLSKLKPNESLDPGEQLKIDFERRVKGNQRLSNELDLLHHDVHTLSAKTPLDINTVRRALDSILEEYYRLPSMRKDGVASEPLSFTQKIMDSQTMSQLIGFLDEIYRAVYYALKNASENNESNTFNFADVQGIAFNIYELRKKFTTSFDILLSNVKRIATALEQQGVVSSETFVAAESNYYDDDSSSSNSESDMNGKYQGPRYRNPFDDN